MRDHRTSNPPQLAGDLVAWTMLVIFLASVVIVWVVAAVQFVRLML